MSRPSDTRNISKTVYQGMVLKRTQRSEYDDNQLRDQARHNARLDHEIKNVERARTVMAKSMEADKQLFIKSGVQNNARVTKSRHGTNTRNAPASQAAAQHTRLISDTRVKRSSVSDTDSLDTGRSSATRSPKQDQLKVTSSTATLNQRQLKDSNNNHNINHQANTTNKNSEVLTNNDSNNNPGAKDRYVGAASHAATSDSLYDSFLLENLSQTSTSKPVVPLATPVRQLDTRSVDNAGGDTTTADHAVTKASSRTPDRRPSGPLGVDFVDRPGQNPDSRRTGLSQPKAKTGIIGHQDRAGQTIRGDNLPGRLRTKWDTLATPKHSSPQLTKRAQIEQEFSRPANRNSSTSPASARLLATFTLTAGTTTPVPATPASSAASAQHGPRQ